MEQSEKSIERPTKIGLLLPLTGKYKNSSIAIRDGFLAAWYLDKEEKEILHLSGMSIQKGTESLVNREDITILDGKNNFKGCRSNYINGYQSFTSVKAPLELGAVKSGGITNESTFSSAS